MRNIKENHGKVSSEIVPVMKEKPSKPIYVYTEGQDTIRIFPEGIAHINSHADTTYATIELMQKLKKAGYIINSVTYLSNNNTILDFSAPQR